MYKPERRLAHIHPKSSTELAQLLKATGDATATIRLPAQFLYISKEALLLCTHPEHYS